MERSKRHIDMRMRMLDDGGPLFAHIAMLPESGLRNERMRQLAYLGLMVEKGAFGRVRNAAREAPAANAATFDSQNDPNNLAGTRTKRKEKL